MGVEDLFKVKRGDVLLSMLGMRVEKWGDLKGKRICVDASNMIYRTITAMKHVEGLMSANGRVTQHVLTIMNYVLGYITDEIEQVWIFDSGVSNPLKGKTIEKRKEKSAAAPEGSTTRFRLSSEEVDEVKQLLTHMGVMYATAPPGVEAEHLCAALTKPDPNGDRFCDYCLSADSDVLPYGGVMLKIPHKKSVPYEIYDIDVVLQGLGLTLAEFRKMCVVLGCDNCDRTPKVGPGTVLKKLPAVKLTPQQELAAKEYAKDIDSSEVAISDPKYDRQGLIDFLTERNFRSSLDRALKVLDERSMTREIK